MKKTIFLLVLTILLAGGAVAQKTSKQTVLSSEVQSSVDPTDIDINPKSKMGFLGKENAAANMDVMNNLLRGNSFVMISDERDSPSSLTVSMDFTPVDGEPGSYTVTSGSWTLVVYENGVYVGAIYGNVTEGTVTDTIDGGTGETAIRSMKATFQITGGMERYADVQSSANITYSSVTDYLDGKNTSATVLNLL